jgi:hypothetical protein
MKPCQEKLRNNARITGIDPCGKSFFGLGSCAAKGWKLFLSFFSSLSYYFIMVMQFPSTLGMRVEWLMRLHGPSSMSRGGHREPQHQPPVRDHQPPASYHPAPQQRQVAQPSTEGHSVHQPRDAASPPVQHPQSARPSGSAKKNKCPLPGCGESFAKSDGLERS